MRVFIGLNAPVFRSAQFKTLEKDIKDSFRLNNVHGFFKRDADFHITLQFLGEITAEQVAKIDFLTPVVKEFYRQDLFVSGMGVLPTWEKARELWLGVRQNPLLDKLHLDVRKRLVDKGFKVDSKPFVPHVTLVSFGAPVNAQTALSSIRQKFSHFEFQPTAINIYQSEKELGASRYKILKSITLPEPPFEEFTD
jgi:2'-5' RNA ligase